MTAESATADDPDWSNNDHDIVDYLRSSVGGGHIVGPGGPTSDGRRFDATIDGDPAEFKTPQEGANSATMRNRAADSRRRGGQARHLIFDVRRAGTSEAESRRGVARIRGAYSKYYDSIRVIGVDFDITEEVR